MSARATKSRTLRPEPIYRISIPKLILLGIIHGPCSSSIVLIARSPRPSNKKKLLTRRYRKHVKRVNLLPGITSIIL